MQISVVIKKQDSHFCSQGTDNVSGSHNFMKTITFFNFLQLSSETNLKSHLEHDFYMSVIRH